MRIQRLVVMVALALFFASIGFAEEPPGPPQPTAEHKALEQWLGDWSGSADLKAGPLGPGGTMTWTENCSWLGGTEFAVVCKSEGDGPMGPAKGIGVITYKAEQKVYTHYGADSSGWSGYSEGTRTGDDGGQDLPQPLQEDGRGG